MMLILYLLLGLFLVLQLLLCILLLSFTSLLIIQLYKNRGNLIKSAKFVLLCYLQFLRRFGILVAEKKTEKKIKKVCHPLTSSAYIIV